MVEEEEEEEELQQRQCVRECGVASAACRLPPAARRGALRLQKIPQKIFERSPGSPLPPNPRPHEEAKESLLRMRESAIHLTR